MRIVTEYLSRGCVPNRYYVIEEPINETGICYQFDTLAEAEAFIAAQEKSPHEADPEKKLHIQYTTKNYR